MDDPVGILFRSAEEFIAFFLNLEFSVNLACGKLHIMLSLGIHIINQIIVGCQAHGDLGISNAFLLVFLVFKIGFDFIVDILDTDEDMLFVPCHDLGMPYVLHLFIYNKTPG